MGMSTIFRKIAVLGQLSRRKRIQLGSSQYRIRSVFVNELALRDSDEKAEPFMDVVYRAALMSKTGIFVDVGANIGQTLFKVLSLDPKRKYVGFEPQISCCFLVQRFIEDNGLKNHTILPLGLSNRNQMVKLHVREGGYDSSASVVDHFRPESFYSSYRYICVRNGDEVMAELQILEISTIKIDVEGAELEVLQGLSETIREQQPFLIFEVLNSYLVLSGQKLTDEFVSFRRKRIDAMESVLRSVGYEIYQVLPESRLKRVDTIQPGSSPDLSATNYVAIAPSHKDAFFKVFPGSVQDQSLQAA